MSGPDCDLWHRLAGYRIGPAQADFSFAQRLARENRWTAEHAERAILEYKRFCYLAMTAGREVTPSDAVDQVWHLHLTYTRDYWERFCPEVLGASLHHGPTRGGTADRRRFYDQYAETLRAYERAFAAAPPPDIWPDARRRFDVDPRAVRVNPADHLVVSRRRAAFGLGLALALILVSVLAAFFPTGGFIP